MKVLYCESGSGKGGSTQSLIQMLTAARGTPIEPTVLCTSRYAQERFEPLGLPVITLDTGGRLGRLGRLAVIRRLLRRSAFDLVHANNDIYSHIPTLLIAARRKIPTVVHHRAVRRLTRSERFLSRFAGHHVAVSHHVRENLLRHGLTPEATSVIYNGVEPVDRAGLDRGIARRDIGLPDGPPLIGYVGTLRPEKGLDLLVEAAGAVVPHHDAHFVIMGADYERAHGYRASLQQTIAERGLADRFHFTGHLADPLPWIGSMDLLVFPTLLPEGFGRAALEGMACGVPVIASAIGALTEIIDDGRTGHLIPPGDAAALGERIGTVLSTDSGPLIERARQEVDARFSPSAQVAELLSLYEKLLD